MQVRNNYDRDVFNGDIGRVAGIDSTNQALAVRYPERTVGYEFTELDEIVPAYATSVHKSQGSEYPVVVLPLTTQHYMMLQRNLLYTAVTRARDLVVIVGTQQSPGDCHQEQPRGRPVHLAAPTHPGGGRAGIAIGAFVIVLLRDPSACASRFTLRWLHWRASNPSSQISEVDMCTHLANSSKSSMSIPNSVHCRSLRAKFDLWYRSLSSTLGAHAITGTSRRLFTRELSHFY